MDLPLEPDARRMEAMGRTVLRRVVRHLASMEQQRAAYASLAEAAASSSRFREPVPEHGTDLDGLLDRVFDDAVPPSLNVSSGGYLAYVPIGGLYEGALADFVAAATNRYMGTGFAGPVLAQIEATTLDWLCTIVGLRGGSGILTSGGSLAQLSAVVAARHDRLGERFADGVLYASDQTHHSVAKAAAIAGFRSDQVRTMRSNAGFGIDVGALEEAMARDAAHGRRPFLVVANAGTTNTGAVDDLPAVRKAAAARGAWFHVDAAYGGMFALTQRGRRLLRGLGQADSITLDPHKGLFLPIGTGALLVRDAQTLRAAHGLRGDYLPGDHGGAPDFSSMGPELTRPFRGLRIWLALKLHGVAPFRQQLDEKLDLARLAAARLADLPGIEVVAHPQLSALAFQAADDARTKAVLAHVNRKGRVHLSGTVLRGRHVGRICVLNHRTHERHVQAAVEDVDEGLRADGGAPGARAPPLRQKAAARRR